MFSTLTQIIKSQDLRNKVLFVLLALIVYRIGSHIPVPGINASLLTNLTSDNGMLGFLNSFSGGALSKFSLFALGIMPYITASIIIQLLGNDVIPILKEWNEQGEYGQKKTKKLTRYLTVIIALVQAIGMSIGFNKMYPGLVPNPSVFTFAIISIVLTLGTVFLMFLGELITKKGIGNGISIIIFAGIVASFPTTIQQLIATEYKADMAFASIVKIVAILALLLAIVMGAIAVLEAHRKIQIQYPKQSTRAGNNEGIQMGYTSHIPLKINSAGVIPVIFSVAIIMTPVSIANFWQGNDVADWIVNHLYYDKPLGMALYAIMIFAFSYFYAFIQMDPKKIADNLQKSGGYIPNTRPGENTQEYISKILSRLTFVGGIFLVVIAVLPILAITFLKLPSSVQLGGTSILIVIGVALEIVKQIESQTVKFNYRRFTK